MTRAVPVALALAICLALPGLAMAVPTITFSAGDHPHAAKGDDNTILDNSDYGLRLDWEGIVHTFHFIDVEMTFDLSGTGDAQLAGTVAHIQSDGNNNYNPGTETLYLLNADFTQIGSQGAWNTNPVPYSDQFEDLAAAGINASNAILYELFDVTLTPVDPMEDTYPGPKLWDEKTRTGDGNEFLIHFRHRLDPADYGPEWNLNVAHGWLQEAVDQTTPGTQDFNFVLRPVPEPSSLFLAGLGLSLLAAETRRRRKK